MRTSQARWLFYSFSNVGFRFWIPDSNADATSCVCSAALFHTVVYRSPSSQSV